MKLGKRKFTGIIAISLAAVALTSVGFAAWTINASDVVVDDESNNVSVTTGTLTDNRFTFTAKINDEDKSVAFDSVVGSGTITGTSGEDLTFKVKANIKGENLTTAVEGIYINFEDTADSKFKNMISGGLIQSPIAFGSDPGENIIKGKDLVAGDEWKDGGKYDDPSSLSKYTYKITSVGEDSLDIDITFSFAWGSAFGGKNPTTAINEAEGSTATMIEKLKTLTSYNSGLELHVVVTAKAKTASA